MRRSRIAFRIFLIVVYAAAIPTAFVVGRWIVGVVLAPFLIWSVIDLRRAFRSQISDAR